MIDALVDAISRAISVGGSYGIMFGVIAFIIVIVFHISKADEEERMKQLPEDEQRRLTIRKDEIESWGTLLGVLGAIGITIWMIVYIFILD